MNPIRDPVVPDHLNPYASYTCSPTQYKKYLQMMMSQNKWDEILELSSSLIQEMTLDLNNYLYQVLTFQEVVCTKSSMIGVPGHCSLKC